MQHVSLNIALLTVSDTRRIETDQSGDLLADRALSSGHRIFERFILPDDIDIIKTYLKKFANNPDIDVVITTGGTGLTGRDVTVEAHESIYEKSIPAFGMVFALVSYKSIGASAVQSRACAGVANGTYFFALPGSPGACENAWDSILQHQFNLDYKPCNFVEIMPRLLER